VCALNEEPRIEATVNFITSVADRELDKYEIVLVNDGSTDKTGEIMDRLQAGNPKIRVLHNERNLNFGGAFRRAIPVTTCDYVLVVAAATVVPPESMATILSHLGEADLIMVYMSDANKRPFIRRIGSAAYVGLLNLLFGFHMHYYNGVIPRRVMLNKITINTNSFASLGEVAIKLLTAGCSYVEVGVPHHHHLKAKSRALRPRNIIGVFKAIISLVGEVRRPGAIPPPAEINALTIPKMKS
jgi:glycosyltransferase involved in cell wall biosynthesis